MIPSRLVARFGPPAEFDRYKVSGTYVFSSDQGHVFTVYDWKETSLYDDGLEEGEESDAPSPEEFWASKVAVPLQIGGRDSRDVGAFKKWLMQQVGSE